ncbi:PAS domain S-box protein [Thermodesulfobacteriota bacterium]
MSHEDAIQVQMAAELEEMRQRVAELTDWKRKHKSVADELIQSEEKFRKLAEKSVVGIYLIQDGLLKYVNRKFEHIFGYEKHEVSNKLEAKAVVHPDDRSMTEENIRKRISGELDAILFQFRGIRKSGRIVTVEAYGSRIEHEGRPAVIGTLVDITVRVEAQRNLAKELDKFQALYDLALSLVDERSLDENLTLIVEKSRELLQTDTAFIALKDDQAGELLGWHISSGLLTEAFRNLRVPVGSGLAGRVAQSGQYVVVEDYFKQISPEFHEVTRAEGLMSGIAVPVQSRGINYGVLLAFNRAKTHFPRSDLDTLSLFGNLAAVEITRKRALERLQESEEKYKRLYEESKRREELYRAFLNSSADSVVIYDLHGGVQYASPSFSGTFGWTAEELNSHPNRFVPESEAESDAALQEKVLSTGEAATGLETKRNTKEGTSLDVSISASRYHDHEGNPAGMSVILRDITAFKSLERARRRAVHHLSHELMTPLSVIDTSVRQLVKPALQDAMRERTAKRIHRNIERLKNIQAAVQDIVIPRRHKPESFQLDAAGHNAVEILRERSAHRSVRLVTRLEPVSAQEIDPAIFNEVLEVLVKNAIENTPDGGRVAISLVRGPAEVLLTVDDRGVGIPPGDREFLFEAFHPTQETESYSTKAPFDFGAGGKGLELMRLKLLSEEGAFHISFETRRCVHIPTTRDMCCGIISSCPFVDSADACAKSGGTVFTVRFPA